MQAILANRRNLLLYLLAWLPLAVALTFTLARGTEFPVVQAAAIAFPMCFLAAFMCVTPWYGVNTTTALNRGLTLSSIEPFVRIALFSGIVWFFLGWGLAASLEWIPSFAGLSARYRSQGAFLFLSGTLLFLLASVVHQLMLIIEESRETEKRTLELQVLAREAELRALRAQIDPHFLFNSLNSISALTVPDPAAARRMCILLAQFMRNALIVGSKKGISFADELKLTETFLEIEKVRFGSRLDVDYQIEPECADCQVPPLLIQPLVENAVRHGIGPLIEGGTISLQARRRGSSIEILLENPFDEECSPAKGTGLGIRNVRERLINLFADDAHVDVDRSEARFRVKLLLPCRLDGVENK